jgi:hypothetical protein
VLAQWELAPIATRGEATALARFDAEERGILEEQLAHGRAIRAERERASAEGRGPDFDGLIESWGGVTIAYRKRMEDSPAYRLNHEEIAEGLEEGVRFARTSRPSRR